MEPGVWPSSMPAAFPGPPAVRRPASGSAPETVARCDATRAAIAAATRPAATAKDNRMPNRPAEAITPEANGPTAKPTIKTAPAMAAPAGPRRSEAHAVQELTARPTPIPTISRPTSNTSACCDTSIAIVPTNAVVDPDQRDGRTPKRVRRPPAQEQAGQQTHRVDSEHHVEGGRAEMVVEADRREAVRRNGWRPTPSPAASSTRRRTCALSPLASGRRVDRALGAVVPFDV